MHLKRGKRKTIIITETWSSTLPMGGGMWGTGTSKKVREERSQELTSELSQKRAVLPLI
jgi:hypothetical protein